MAKFSGPMFAAIKKWVEEGCTCVQTHVVYRYQATYPNTICVIFEQPTIDGMLRDWACQDVHYTGGRAFQALGGFWIRGLDDQEMKPEQDCKSPLRRTMYANLKGKAPNDFPEPNDLETYAAAMQTLVGKY